MIPETIPGWVSRFQSGFYTIQTEKGKVVCVLRGRLKRRTIQGDVISIGDRVQISLLSDGTGAVEFIEPRHSELVRLDPTPRGDFRQILLSNPDQLVAVFACTQPEPHLRMLDRFLVIAEKQGLKAMIVANKVDLIGLRNARKIFGVYPPLGYPVIYTSAKEELGLKEFQKALVGRISALAGPSGVGKSSLLNAIQPGLGLAVREISAWNDRGKHTTVVREMFPVEGGGFVADLPGLRKLSLWDTEPEELDGYFPELRVLVSKCQFNDCTHFEEPGCAVIKAVEEGTVSAERYESYVRLRMGDG
ncbi:MAG: ribosome small subunit-dependent GTPase A [Chloroflexi bacterium HGW-Chloroflexi-4]|jgi:ribosome biogenesis GTPase|nr:MAG: ribosome small subunit-dependent GTPase A [Chloroflexi bacterium HGW-Chloroflexi-4]